MYSKINLIVKFVFLLLFFSSLNAQNLSESEFEEILSEIVQKVSTPAFLEFEIADFKGVAYVNKTGAGQYELGLQGYEAGDTYGVSTVHVTTLTKNAVITNHGDHCTYKFVSEAIPRVLHDKIMSYDEIKDFEEWVRKEASEAQVNMDVVANEYTLTASYKYNGDKDEIVKNLWPVVNWSRHSITLIWKAKKEYYVEFRDELLDNDMKPLTNDQVIFLLEDDDLYDTYVENEDALGAWEFEVNDVSFELYNYPDRIEMCYFEFAGKDLSEDIRKNIFDEMNKYVNDNKLSDASSTELVWDEFDPNFLKVIIKFKYDETIEGNDFFDSYYKIYNDEGFNFVEQLYTVLDKLGIE